MRKWLCVPMIILSLLSGCGKETPESEDVRLHYREMAGCTMEATITCEQESMEWQALLRCDYTPDGTCTVEVLSPEHIAGVRAVIDGGSLRLEYEDVVLDAGILSGERIAPAEGLSRLMDALRSGWLLEENPEEWNGIPCQRLLLEQSGAQTEVLAAVWLRQDDGTPLRGEISVDGENILTAEFTSFLFYDTIEDQGA